MTRRQRELTRVPIRRAGRRLASDGSAAGIGTTRVTDFDHRAVAARTSPSSRSIAAPQAGSSRAPRRRVLHEQYTGGWPQLRRLELATRRCQKRYRARRHRRLLLANTDCSDRGELDQLTTTRGSPRGRSVRADARYVSPQAQRAELLAQSRTLAATSRVPASVRSERRGTRCPLYVLARARSVRAGAVSRAPHARGYVLGELEYAQSKTSAGTRRRRDVDIVMARRRRSREGPA